MESSMTFSSVAALFGAMFALAIIPGPSVFAVVARSIASGFTHGLVTTLGLVAGDFIFILMAVFGLWTVAETMGSLLVVVKYLGGAYLIWLGIGIWRSRPELDEIEGVNELSWASNFLSGLFITLGDPKAILFYVSFLPAFIDLSAISIIDTSVIMLTASVALVGAKLGYAYMADKSRLLFKSPRAKKIMDITAGSVMMGTGIFILVQP
ncbi:MAG TPA: hypothetical protein DDW55_02000 [Gammaproteobacteria bacterium]|nr:hypothetical protein [Gammaproteobacteria bacterium]